MLHAYHTQLFCIIFPAQQRATPQTRLRVFTLTKRGNLVVIIDRNLRKFHHDGVVSPFLRRNKPDAAVCIQNKHIIKETRVSSPQFARYLLSRPSRSGSQDPQSSPWPGSNYSSSGVYYYQEPGLVEACAKVF